MTRGWYRSWGSICVVAVASMASGTGVARGAPTPAATDHAGYVGVDPSAEAAGRVASVLAAMRPPVTLADAPVHIETLTGDEPLLVLGLDATQGCQSEPVDGEAFGSLVAELYQATLSLEDTALLIQRIEASQTCLTGVADPAVLTRFRFLEGVIAFSDGDAEQASSAFRDLFTIDPEYPWDPEYPPPARSVFDAAAAEVAGRVSSSAWIALTPGSGVWLDGVALGAGDTAVNPGWHVLQHHVAGGTFESAAVLLGQGQRLVLFERASLDGLVDGEPAAVEAASVLFEALGEGAPDVLVALGPEVRVWRWGAESTTLTALDVSRTAARMAVRDAERRGAGPHPIGPVILGLGIGLAAAGAVVSLATDSQLRAFNEDVESGARSIFPLEDDPGRDDSELYQEWQRLTAGVKAGLGLLTAGGVVVVVSLPVGLAAGGARREVALQATMIPGPPGVGTAPGPAGFSLAVSIR